MWRRWEAQGARPTDGMRRQACKAAAATGKGQQGFADVVQHDIQKCYEHVEWALLADEAFQVQAPAVLLRLDIQMVVHKISTLLKSFCPHQT